MERPALVDSSGVVGWDRHFICGQAAQENASPQSFLRIGRINTRGGKPVRICAATSPDRVGAFTGPL
jgi:hypothetical protein